MKSLRLGSIRLIRVALGTAILGLHVLEREIYVKYAYLAVCPSIASKEKTGRK